MRLQLAPENDSINILCSLIIYISPWSISLPREVIEPYNGALSVFCFNIQFDTLRCIVKYYLPFEWNELIRYPVHDFRDIGNKP